MFKNFANLLTLLRMALIPIMVGLFFVENSKCSIAIAILFIIACLTDYLDGFIARAFFKTSYLGTVLDPLADKLLIASIIIMLIGFNKITNILLIPSVIIICREILISGLREFLSGINVSLGVSRIAKLKTVVQMTSLCIFILTDVFPNYCLKFVGACGLWIAAILTLFTGFSYLKKSFIHFKK